MKMNERDVRMALSEASDMLQYIAKKLDQCQEAIGIPVETYLLEHEISELKEYKKKYIEMVGEADA